MVRVRDVGWALAAIALFLPAPRAAHADPVTLTGNVANDFTTSNGSVMIPLVNPAGEYMNGPGFVDGPNGSDPNTLVAGVDMKNIWINYNASTDTMYVGIQGFTNVAGKEEIFGDLSGNLNPALDSSPAVGPIASATNTFLGLKAVALAFAPTTQNASGQNVMGTPTIIAGIPQDKSQGGSGTIDGFTVSNFSPNGAGLPFNFGTQLAGAGNLAFNTTAATPDFEFTINNFSKISGINPANGFYIEGYAGMPGNRRWQVAVLVDRGPSGAPELQRPGAHDLAGLAAAGGRGGLAVSPPAGGSPVIWVPGIGSAF